MIWLGCGKVGVHARWKTKNYEEGLAQHVEEAREVSPLTGCPPASAPASLLFRHDRVCSGASAVAGKPRGHEPFASPCRDFQKDPPYRQYVG